MRTQERRHRTGRAELLDHTPVCNLTHQRRILAEHESFYSEHWAPGTGHRALGQAAPLHPLPDNVTDLNHVRVARRDRTGGILHEYHISP